MVPDGMVPDGMVPTVPDGEVMVPDGEWVQVELDGEDMVLH
jgi:hypothetical protein